MISPVRRLVILTLTPLITYIGLSIFIQSYFTQLLADNFWDNFYFGTDIPRHIEWATNPSVYSRSHLHPLSLILFKIYGCLLLLLGVIPNYSLFPIISFPVTLFTSIAIAYTIHIMLPGHLFPVWIQAFGIILLLLVGSTLTFAPIPESHTLGGAALLLQAAFTWHFLKKESENFALKKTFQHNWCLIGICLFLAMAFGFSLINLMPGTILLLAVPQIRPILFSKLFIRTTLLSGGILISIVIFHYFIISISFLSVIENEILKDVKYVFKPEFKTLKLSIKNFLLSQFGLGFLKIIEWTTNEYVFRKLKLAEEFYLQIAAFFLYMSGIVNWAWRKKGFNNLELKYILYCAAAFLSLLFFHCIYAVEESYMFTPHGWPFLVVPGILVLRDSWLQHNQWPIIFISLTLLLCALQIALGILKLFQ
jgi:hypothetical protein